MQNAILTKTIYGLYIYNGTYELNVGKYRSDLIKQGDQSDGYGEHRFKIVGDKDRWMIML
jgi:hypothetical protein